MSKMNGWAECRRKNGFFLHLQSGTHMKAEEKLIEFISLNLIYKIVNEDNGSSLKMCGVMTLGKDMLS